LKITAEVGEDIERRLKGGTGTPRPTSRTANATNAPPEHTGIPEFDNVPVMKRES